MIDLLIVLLGAAITAGYFTMAGCFAGAWSDGSEGAERKFPALFPVIRGLAAIASYRAMFG